MGRPKELLHLLTPKKTEKAREITIISGRSGRGGVEIDSHLPQAGLGYIANDVLDSFHFPSWDDERVPDPALPSSPFPLL